VNGYLHVPADPTLMLKASYQAFPFFLLLKTQYSAITEIHGTLAQSLPPQFPQTHYYYNYHYCTPPCSPPTCQCTPCPQKTQLPKNQTHPPTPSKGSIKLHMLTNPSQPKQRRKKPRKGKHQANPATTTQLEPHNNTERGMFSEIAMNETEQEESKNEQEISKDEEGRSHNTSECMRK